MSKAPMENQRFVNSTASSSFVAPLMGLPQIVETVPHILMPASVAFLMQRSASLQYCESVVPELAKWCSGSVETIMRMRSGPIPLLLHLDGAVHGALADRHVGQHEIVHT